MIELTRGTPDDLAELLRLFDDNVAWLVARGQTKQWGTEPFSANEKRVALARTWAESGGLWFAEEEGEKVGALVVGEHLEYVPPPDRPELYVQLLLTSPAHRGKGIGARLIAKAVELARDQGAEQLRVDCFAGDPALPAQYERLGFTHVSDFVVHDDWPGSILVMEL